MQERDYGDDCGGEPRALKVAQVHVVSQEVTEGGTEAALLFVTREWQSPSSISARTYVFLALSGIATGASWLCYFRALKIGEASRVAPLDKLSVVLVAVFAFVFLGERLSGLHWLGASLIAAGAIMLAIK